MKKLIALFALLPLLAFADGKGIKDYYASINIHTNNYANYEVYIDGYRYDLRDRLFVDRLQPGMHRIKVVEHRINRRGYGYAEVIYRDDVFLAHGSVLQACIDNYGNFRIDRVVNYCPSQCRLRHVHNHRVARQDCRNDNYRQNDRGYQRGHARGNRR